MQPTTTEPVHVVATIEPESMPLAIQEQTADRNPALVYLAGLRESGRRGMLGQLRKAVAVLTGHPAPVGEGVEGRTAVVRAFPWAGLRYQHLVALRTALVAEGLAPASINTCLAAVSGTLREAWKLGQMTAEDYHRAAAVDRIKAHRLPAGRALKLDEVRRLAVSCRNAQQRAILAVAFAGGLRRAEVVGLDLEDWNDADGTLRVEGKGGKQRLVPLAGEAATALRIWIEERGGEAGPLFVPVDRQGRVGGIKRMSTTAVYRTLERLAKAAGVASVSPHDLRRTFVSTLLDNGADVLTVSRMAGHSSPAITQRYDRRDERAAHEAAKLIAFPA